jgi:hypothetical protein
MAARSSKQSAETETIGQAPGADATAPEGAAKERDLAVESYVLFCKGQAEGEFPAWEELPPQTQKLWREGYDHVAGGGKPRTDYEHVVKYHLLAAQ